MYRNQYYYNIIKRNYFVINEVISNKNIDFSSDSLPFTINRIKSDFKNTNIEIQTFLSEVLDEIKKEIPNKLYFFEERLKYIKNIINNYIGYSYNRKMNISNHFKTNIIEDKKDITHPTFNNDLNIYINRIPYLPFNEESIFKENKDVYIFNEESKHITSGYIKYTTIEYVNSYLKVYYDIFDKEDDTYLFSMEYKDFLNKRNNVKGKILSAILDKKDAINYAKSHMNEYSTNFNKVFHNE